MWLITTFGFFSVVQKPDDVAHDTLTIRARVHMDLLTLREQYLPCLGEVHISDDTDYRYRASAKRSEVIKAISLAIQDLQYSNFKDTVALQQGKKRASLYGKVWSVLNTMQGNKEFDRSVPAVSHYGGVLVSGGGRVLLRAPANQFGGYAWTFAKTGIKPGISPHATALRAVKEKTGYTARIRAVIPGAFESDDSNSSYFLMDAQHPPASHNWQTENLKWVTFEDARILIRQSANQKGRDRDLSILDAAQAVFKRIPYAEHMTVQPEDWPNLQTELKRFDTLYPTLRYSAEEMVKIRRGFLPTVQEEKWFLVFSGNRLRMHRSWTGLLIFDVGFEFDQQGAAHVSDIIVSREKEHYSHPDSDEELRMMQDIIRYHLLEPLDAPIQDGIVMAARHAAQPGYLGSPQVVQSILEPVIQTMVELFEPDSKVDEHKLNKVMLDATRIFIGQDSQYTTMPQWHTMNGIGENIQKYLTLPEQLQADADFKRTVTNGIGSVMVKAQELIAEFLEDPAANWEEHALLQLNALQDFACNVLLGTNTVIHGEKTISDFSWQAAA